MNFIDLYVTEVLSISHEIGEGYDVWVVKVNANSHGSIQPTEIHLNTEEEARNVEVGYKFSG